MNTPVPIRCDDLLPTVGCGILQATVLALGHDSRAREDYTTLVCPEGVQGIALVLRHHHLVVCQLLV